jgi:hypothetical protein
MPTETTTATEAAPTSANTGAAAPVETTTTAAPVEEGSFISEALKQLAPHQEGAAKQDTTPVDPPKEEAPVKEEAPADPLKDGDDEEGRKAEEDIKRETPSMPPQQKAAFTKLRYELRDKNRQLKAAMEAQQQQGGEKVADPELTAEVERLRAENEATKQRLSQFDEEFFATRVELTDEFKAQITAPRDEVAKAIGEISDRYEGLAPEEVVRAVQSADPTQVAKVTADMNEFDRYRFYQLVDKYREISQKETVMRKNAKETLDRLETERRSKTEAQTTKEREEWKTALERTWEKVTEDFPVIAPIDGADDWNAQVEKVKAFASPDRFGKLTTQEKAETLYRAAAFPVLAAELENLRASLEEAQGKLSKYEGASPSLDTAGGGGGQQITVDGVPEGADIQTAMAAMLKKAGIG